MPKLTRKQKKVLGWCYECHLADEKSGKEDGLRLMKSELDDGTSNSFQAIMLEELGLVHTREIDGRLFAFLTPKGVAHCDKHIKNTVTHP